MKHAIVLLVAAAGTVGAAGALRSDADGARAVVGILALLPGVLLSFVLLVRRAGGSSSLASWPAFDAGLKRAGLGTWLVLALIFVVNALGGARLAEREEPWAVAALGMLALMGPVAAVVVAAWRWKLAARRTSIAS